MLGQPAIEFRFLCFREREVLIEIGLGDTIPQSQRQVDALLHGQFQQLFKLTLGHERTMRNAIETFKSGAAECLTDRA